MPYSVYFESSSAVYFEWGIKELFEARRKLEEIANCLPSDARKLGKIASGFPNHAGAYGEIISKSDSFWNVKCFKISYEKSRAKLRYKGLKKGFKD